MRRLLLPVLFILLLGLVVVLDARRRDAEKRLEQISVQLEQVQNPEQSREKARGIVKKVQRHVRIPDTPEPTVAAILDVAKLRERNAFYAKAENGDYLIVTQTRAILYDPEGDVILDMVPVQVQPAAAPGDATAPTEMPSAAAETEEEAVPAQ